MTQEEDKNLLLIDLCARLPYCTKIYYYYFDKNLVEKEEKRELDFSDIETLKYNNENEPQQDFWRIKIFKPYLRPMSSMTEEEYEDLSNFSELDCGYNLVKTNLFETEGVWSGSFFLSSLIDWLNAHHFDYRGLIEKGLALEAPENMYKQ